MGSPHNELIGRTHKKGLAGERDAIHVPVALVRLHEDSSSVCAGQHVRFVDEQHVTKCLTVEDDGYWDREPYDRVAHAIVDPFLPYDFDHREMFYVFLVPGVAVNIRHHFDVCLEVGKRTDYRDYEEDECRGCY